MKKLIVSALTALVVLNGSAQTIIVNHWHDHHPVPHHYHHNDSKVAVAAAATVGAIGAVAIIDGMMQNAQEARVQRQAAQAAYEQRRAEAVGNYQYDLAQANNFLQQEDYINALNCFVRCAQANDRFQHSLGDQESIVNEINYCNAKLGNTAKRPSVLNNDQARMNDYSQYDIDIQRPVYKTKSNECDARITRVSCDGKETRIEFEYTNTNFGMTAINVKDNTYIKGKKSGKLPLARIENITMYPSSTVIPYGCQTLKFALIFPALDPEDKSFSFCEPSTDWQFKDITCL